MTEEKAGKAAEDLNGPAASFELSASVSSASESEPEPDWQWSMFRAENETLGIVPRISALRAALPEAPRALASNVAMLCGLLCPLLAVIWLVALLQSPHDRPDDLGFLFQLCMAAVLFLAGYPVWLLAYRSAIERELLAWNRIYEQSMLELRSSSLPALIADPEVWKLLLARDKSTSLILPGPPQVQGLEQCLQYAAAYFDALREFRDKRRVSPSLAINGQLAYAALLQGEGRRGGPDAVVNARLAAICDYFCSDLEEDSPPAQGELASRSALDQQADYLAERPADHL